MAKLIVETRSFTDRNTGVSTEYEYIAVRSSQVNKRTGKPHEVQLKNLVQSEKTALTMIADAEYDPASEIISRPTNKEEQEAFIDIQSNKDGIDLFDGE